MYEMPMRPRRMSSMHEDDAKEAFLEGKYAALEGRADCPYRPGTSANRFWWTGWKTGETQRLNKQGAGQNSHNDQPPQNVGE
jgi:hypothetical protein